MRISLISSLETLHHPWDLIYLFLPQLRAIRANKNRH